MAVRFREQPDRQERTQSEAEEKLLPQNIDAEMGVLGSILIDPTILLELEGILEPEDFYREAHRLIYEAMCDLRKVGSPADLITVCDELERRGRLDEVGGAASVSALANQVPTSSNATHYARIVTSKKTMRRLIEAAGKIAAIAYGEPDEEQAIAQAEKLIASTRLYVEGRSGEAAIGIRGFTTARELLDTTLPDPEWAVPDLIPTGLTLLAGKTKMGKSWMVLGLALALATSGSALGKTAASAGDVLYLALEDTDRRLQQRMRQLLRGDDQRAGLDQLHFAKLWPRLDEGGVAWLDRWAANHPNARLIIIDTLAKVRPDSRPNASAYAEDYAALEGLKAVADRRHLAIVVIHHLRKEPSQNDPLDEVSGTTGLTGVADTILVLRRERGRDDATLHVTGRDVDEQQLALSFDGTTGTWTIAGDAHEVRVSQQRREIVELLQMEGPKRPWEIARDLHKDPNTTRVLLRKMLFNGELVSDANHRYSPATSVHSINSVNGINGNGLGGLK